MPPIKAIRTTRPGGAEVLEPVFQELDAPRSGEVLLRQTAIGVNLIDVYHRTAISGQYAIDHPAILGVEAAGVVEEVGPGVSGFHTGDRVAYWMVRGAYAQKRLIDASRLVKLPDFVSDEIAAACLVKGTTAQYLLHRIYAVKQGDVVLVHSAAGGVGQLLCQWAKYLGAMVIGTVGSIEKMPIAKAMGCDHVILYRDTDFAGHVRQLTAGRGVDVVYDSIGKDTFAGSLDALRPLGTMVSFGQASGPVDAIDISVLAQKGSIFLAKPTLATFIQERSDIESLAEGLFEVLASGAVKVDIKHRVPLEDVALMHEALESRNTTGSIILIP
ncbi:quinone oxidoreductase [Pollutimonas subterranea]|uniref:Quinone oxidoreductase n=1 Tax=Pollutimonas subterranea TaxID=2045210 RepID=A0A2N4U2I0_9BURK|nr:quinone oxidoreductase [Pollutimonas subterranea]PLC49217.1 quinone oxidoreductase [Pollutimonas subterranea]